MKTIFVISILCVMLSDILCIESCKFCSLKTYRRFTRAPKECRYEKGPWEECDVNSGVQRRALKLKPTVSSTTTCDSVRYIQRPCKKNCRYSKGTWSECSNGLRYRLDTPKGDSSPLCEPFRNITKTCKEQCRYSKSEWSMCENGIKTKTLTLITDGINQSSGCQSTKLITKECRHPNQKDKKNKRGRKNNIGAQTF